MSDITLAESQRNHHFRRKLLNFTLLGFNSPVQLVCNSVTAIKCQNRQPIKRITDDSTWLGEDRVKAYTKGRNRKGQSMTEDD